MMIQFVAIYIAVSGLCSKTGGFSKVQASLQALAGWPPPCPTSPWPSGRPPRLRNALGPRPTGSLAHVVGYPATAEA